MHRPGLSALILCWVVCTAGAEAAPDQSCKRLIPILAKEAGVPAALLMAIAYVESGFHAYAINSNGESLQFQTPGDSLAYVQKKIAQGNTNIDMGCMQINWKAHQGQFESPKDLLSPSQNIRYAAAFLKSLYEEFGTWAKAVSAYHSRSPDKGKIYLLKVATYLTNERQNYDQRQTSKRPYQFHLVYRPPSCLGSASFLWYSLDSLAYSRRLSLFPSNLRARSRSPYPVSSLLSNKDVKASFLWKCFSGFVRLGGESL
jgi:hypothetical protein